MTFHWTDIIILARTVCETSSFFDKRAIFTPPHQTKLGGFQEPTVSEIFQGKDLSKAISMSVNCQLLRISTRKMEKQIEVGKCFKLFWPG